MSRPKTAGEIDEFRKDYATLLKKDLVARYGSQWSTLRSWARDVGAKRAKAGIYDSSGLVDLNDLDIQSLPTYNELIKLFQQYSKVSQKYNIKDEMSISIEAEKPTAIVFTADWHLGHPGVDYDLFDADMKLIEETPNLYVYLGGDQIENMLLNPTITEGQQMDQNLQYAMLNHILDKLHNKILAVGTGNHNAWTEKLAKIDFLRFILDQKKLIYTRYGGMMHVKVGDINYDIYRRHSWKMNSSLNLSHSMKQHLRMEKYDWSVCCFEHGHVPVLEEFYYKDKKRIALKAGSYKTLFDDFADSKGFTGVKAANPTVILNPKRFEMLGFMDMHDAITVLRGLNG